MERRGGGGGGGYRLDTFMVALVGGIVSNSGYVASVAEFVRKRAINAVKEELK